MAQLTGTDYATFLARAAEVVAARDAYATLDSRLDAIVASGGNVATLTNGTAAAGQKNVTVDSVTGFIAGARVAYTLAGGSIEYNVIASISDPTLVMTTNIGTGGISDNTYISMISPSEYAAANAINRSGSLTLPQAMGYAAGNIYNAQAYGLSASASASTNTAALQAAIDAATSSALGGQVYVPAGTYSVNGTISIDTVQGLRLAGDGLRTKFLWAGTTGIPAFELVDARNCVVSSFQLVADSGAPLSIGFRLHRSGSATVVPKDNSLRDIWIQGTNGHIYTAIQIGGSGATDQNNDFHTFSNVVVNNYRDYGVDGSSQASQSYGNLFVNCQMLGVAGTSIASYYCGDGGGFHFNVLGGATLGNNADFWFGRSYQPYSIRGVNGEGSKRLAYSNHGTYLQVHFADGRWSGENLNSDDNAVDMTAGRSNVTFSNYSIGDGQATTGILRLKVASASDGGSLVVESCRIYTTDTTPFSSSFPTRSHGNLIITDEGAGTTVAMEPCYSEQNDALAPTVFGFSHRSRSSTTGLIWFESGVAGQTLTWLAQAVFTIYNNYPGATGQPIFTLSGANITTVSGQAYVFICNGASWYQVA